MPPPASEGLEQRGRVGESSRLGLHQADARLLVLTLGDKRGEIAHATEPELLLLDPVRFYEEADPVRS
jgi:hypothetical protein